MIQHLLHISHVSKHFGGNVAVSDVSFSVDEKEIFGLIGPNGAGKTTLFNCMTGFYPATAGDVIFDNKKINALRPDEVCRLGMVRTWQRVKPLGTLTVLENVMIGAFAITNATRDAEAIARENLQAVGLSDYADKLAGSLPIGLKKKLELARVLATHPKMLLLDEICGGLNHTETDTILEIIRRVRKQGATIVFIEHDMKAVTSICDRIVVLNSGEKLAEGTPEEITNNPDVIAAYLGGGYNA
ncbi:ABC transporter ATP-binding protein [Pelodictyon phaeoclathratiforme]|jgi:branched-chain amino acid transport system ATP-binding protein|uniref:ABC transporter related n=1 Tax=Pelodictyon phaeoclathratiforme (strain DSM 5477 / BU-1) TaxID=324925 RepID=B4SBK4_PELPB|nr:ABC transporter ATP-binding protein [Pelodictyon phaeoclathratiforme]ACF44058.1 ABC transporter related [Pelodictyon phaeoclathratiforme BU-1]MBV5288261.1 ABC transporter ATP-binding protein [Pelodictyon phaeoclathratiforme]